MRTGHSYTGFHLRERLGLRKSTLVEQTDANTRNSQSSQLSSSGAAWDEITGSGLATAAAVRATATATTTETTAYTAGGEMFVRTTTTHSSTTVMSTASVDMSSGFTWKPVGARARNCGAPSSYPSGSGASARIRDDMQASSGFQSEREEAKERITPEDPIAKVMSSPAMSIDADESVFEAHKLMREKGISSLLVTCVAENKVGVITKTDVVTKTMGADPSRMSVRRVMSSPLATIPHTSTIYECSIRMKECRLRRLFVTDSWDPAAPFGIVGVVSDTDLFHRLHIPEPSREPSSANTVQNLSSMQVDEQTAEERMQMERRRRWRERGMRVLEERQQSGRGSLADVDIVQEDKPSVEQHVDRARELVDSNTSHGNAAGEDRGANEDRDDRNQDDLREASYRDNMGAAQRTSSDHPWTIDFSELVLEKRVAFGGFAEVYKANWRGTEVAVKRLLWDRFDARLFERECTILQSLRHPNILLLLGYSMQQPNMALVTEYCARGSLDRLLHSNMNLSLRKRLGMLCQACKGMAYLHSLRPPIVHRDLKPANLLVTAGGDIKVGDFGLSRDFRNSYASVNSHSAVGTVLYSAPEVLRNEGYSPKADVWSFGVVLWETLTRAAPFANYDKPMAVAANVAFNGERVPLSSLENEDPRLVGLVEKCLEAEPEKRPSFDSMLEELRAVYLEEVAKETSTSSASMSRNISAVSVPAESTEGRGQPPEAMVCSDKQ